jgi:acetyl esterase/lipase
MLTDSEMRQLGPDAIAEDTRMANAALRVACAGVPSWWEIGADRMRALRAAGGTEFPPPWRSERGYKLIAEDGRRSVALHVIAPERPDGIYLHFHAGGWVLGSADQQDSLLEKLSQRANLACVSVDYRLAPEHPYPAAPEDCETAAIWIWNNAESLFGTSRLLIGGESAGAHLAVLTLLRLREHFGRHPFRAACLSYGAYDLSLTPSVRQADQDSLVLTRIDIEHFVDAFLSPEVDRSDPQVSPLYADLRGLCPALFTIGSLDPLVDDTLFMTSRWKAAGNAAELNIYPGGCHGFVSLPNRIGNEALEAAAAYLARAAA